MKTQTNVVALRLGFLTGAKGEEVKVDFSLLTASSVMLESAYVRGREKSIAAVMAYTFDLVVSFPFIKLLFRDNLQIRARRPNHMERIGASATTLLLYSVGKFLTGFLSGPQHHHIHL